MSRLAVRVEELGKEYRIGERAHYRTLRERLNNVVAGRLSALPGRQRRQSRFTHAAATHFWALRHVSFELEQGELLGIIGRNGAGKSTLLKILSKITEPTEGVAEVRGRVRSLLEVGTGFHPELTGRENIYLNGAILGMPRIEINRKFDEIVAFAEVDRFLDTPVKWYSSGMYTRLAFSVAAHLQPDVLIVDEVLAVGDAAFQRKCLGKMSQVATEGRTVLFVSHNVQAVERLCQRALLLRAGEVVYDATASATCLQYLDGLAGPAVGPDLEVWANRQGDGRARITRLEILDRASGEAVDRLTAGQDFIVRLHYRTTGQIRGPLLGFSLLTTSGTSIFNTRSDDFGMEIPVIEGNGIADIAVSGLTLAPGGYVCNLAISDRLGQSCDYLRDVACFQVDSGECLPKSRSYDQSCGVIYPLASWKLQ
jgi:lipopolysaccharide transport system ATP-binding protein